LLLSTSIATTILLDRRMGSMVSCCGIQCAGFNSANNYGHRSLTPSGPTIPPLPTGPRSEPEPDRTFHAYLGPEARISGGPLEVSTNLPSEPSTSSEGRHGMDSSDGWPHGSGDGLRLPPASRLLRRRPFPQRVPGRPVALPTPRGPGCGDTPQTEQRDGWGGIAHRGPNQPPPSLPNQPLPPLAL